MHETPTPGADQGQREGHSRPIPKAVSAQPLPDDAGVDHPSLYFNRELSWIDFNWRVLHQAIDSRIPLLERVNFLAITQSNLDEFFRKRVGGLKSQQAAGVRQLSPDGRTPSEQIHLVRKAAGVMQAEMSSTWRELLRPALHEEGIVVHAFDDLGARVKQQLQRYFMRHIYPILTPLAVDPGHPFPFISNQSLSLAVLLRHPGREDLQFARLKIPVTRDRWIPLKEPGHFVALEDLVRNNVAELFRGTEIVSCEAFRVTRNADLRREDDDAEDLIEMISEELRERRFAPVVRLEVDHRMPERVVKLLCTELLLERLDVYRIHGPIDFSGFSTLAQLDRPELRFPPWEPVWPKRLHRDPVDGEGRVIDVLRRGDVMVHHPYESFTASVQRFVEEAADDPRVLAIKLTVYRTTDDSPIVRALIRAAEAGKQVACLVEVTARFDEQRNIDVGQRLERAGVHVTYGLVGLKTHAKVALVVRDEENGIRAYSHIGTGNYHTDTARVYTDLGLLTASREVGADLVNFFHHLTGHAPEQEYKALIVAPRDLRRVLEELVEREIQHQQEGRDGRMILKMNAIDDLGMIQLLYRASQEGVQIDLIVRGHTRLRPGVAHFSDNIRLVSIIGRFLEHDRIFFFRNGGDHDVLVGSADWRRRNLEERVEALVRITDRRHRKRLRRILEQALEDNRLAWDLGSDGRYTLRYPAPDGPVRDYHARLIKHARKRRVRAIDRKRVPPRRLT